MAIWLREFHPLKEMGVYIGVKEPKAGGGGSIMFFSKCLLLSGVPDYLQTHLKHLQFPALETNGFNLAVSCVT